MLQGSYEQLRKMGAKYEEIKNKGDQDEAVKGSEMVNQVLRATLIELSTTVRKMLGLKQIRLQQ